MNNSDLVGKLATAYQSVNQATKDVLAEAHEQVSSGFAAQSALPVTQAYLKLIETIGSELQASSIVGLEQKLYAACEAIKLGKNHVAPDTLSSQGSVTEKQEKKMILYSEAINLWMTEDKKAGKREVTRAAYFHRFKVLDEENEVYMEKRRDRIHRVDENGLLKAIGEYVYSSTNSKPKQKSASELSVNNSNQSANDAPASEYISYATAIEYIESEDKKRGINVGLRTRQIRIKKLLARGLKVTVEKGRVRGIELQSLREKLVDFYQSRGAGSDSNSTTFNFVDPAVLQRDRVEAPERKEEFVLGREAIEYCTKFEQARGLTPRLSHTYGEWLRKYTRVLAKIRLVQDGDKHSLSKNDLDRELEIYVQKKLRANRSISLAKPAESVSVVQPNPVGDKSVEKAIVPQPNKDAQRKVWSEIRERVEKGENPETALNTLGILDESKRAGYLLAVKRYIPSIKQNPIEN